MADAASSLAGVMPGVEAGVRPLPLSPSGTCAPAALAVADIGWSTPPAFIGVVCTTPAVADVALLAAWAAVPGVAMDALLAPVPSGAALAHSGRLGSRLLTSLSTPAVAPPHWGLRGIIGDTGVAGVGIAWP